MNRPWYLRPTDLIWRIVTDWLTETDGSSFCIVRFLCTWAAVDLILAFQNTPVHHSDDYRALAYSLTALGAVIVGKNLSERLGYRQGDGQ